MSPRDRWKDQLQRTTATECLRTGRPDDFPLAEVQALTDELLRTSSTGSFWKASTGVRAQTPDADEVLGLALAPIEGRLRLHESGLLAALHAFSPGVARNRLLRLVPDAGDAAVDGHFDDRLAIYLQCVIVAHKAREMACDENECRAARELFWLVKLIKRRSFEKDVKKLPRVWRLLRLCGEGSVEDLVPFDVVVEVMRRGSYARIFAEEVRRLQRLRLWSELYDLVGGAGELARYPRVHPILALVLPPSEMRALMRWQPNVSRIKLWSDKLPLLVQPEQRPEAEPILVLEGPDSTGQQNDTLLHSCPGPFQQLHGAAPIDGVSLLERLLEAFDKALGAADAEALQWILFTCTRNPASTTRDMIRDSLEALTISRGPGSTGTELSSLKRYMEWSEGGSAAADLGSRLAIIAAAIPVIGSGPRLRVGYGRRYFLERRASDLLKEAQQRLCVLVSKRPADGCQLAIWIRVLGQAMLDASWMHHGWTPSYVDMLRRIPSEGEIRRAFELMWRSERTDGDGFSKQRDFVAQRVGGSFRPDPTPNLRLSEVQQYQREEEKEEKHEEKEENPWLHCPLDADRAALRETILDVTPDIPSSLLASCIEQSLQPLVADSFIRDLDAVLADTDQACVNLANLLGPRAVPGAARGPHACWTALLAHLMRRRPPGLMARCGAQLSRETWAAWARDLRRLFGEAELAELGFTAEGMAAVGRGKSLPARVVSVASAPPGIAGGLGRGRRGRLFPGGGGGGGGGGGADGGVVSRSSTTGTHRRNVSLLSDDDIYDA